MPFVKSRVEALLVSFQSTQVIYHGEIGEMLMEK